MMGHLRCRRHRYRIEVHNKEDGGATVAERFEFSGLREILAKANEEKSGDRLAGIAATSDGERVAAKMALADVPLRQIARQPLIAAEEDEVTRLIEGSWDEGAFRPIAELTVGEFREFLLHEATDGASLRALRWGVTPEMAAAVTKLMSNRDLVLGASKIRNVTRCRNTLGERGVLGIRLQPNHPADDLGGILAATVEGLFYGCGDAVIGVNPATDSVGSVASILKALAGLIERYEIPTQACCLAHITTQLAALEEGAPVDLLFQSVAGTELANRSFGISLAMLREGRERVLERHRRRGAGTGGPTDGPPAGVGVGYGPTDGPPAAGASGVGEQVMYFETGQGSALSAGAHHGIDQLTLEARAYGVARAFDPFLVNTVVGFIGPEYLYDERQIIRAGLEDHFMGKLLGLPMGCDVCYTNHAEADQNSADNLLLLLGAAGCNYFMGVPCSDDVMLNYQSTSYHDALAVRKLFGLRPAPEFLAWLQKMGIYKGLEPASPSEELHRQMARGLELALKGAADDR
jgi:ethanolamine ammonia-lyase large subunit